MRTAIAANDYNDYSYYSPLPLRRYEPTPYPDYCETRRYSEAARRRQARRAEAARRQARRARRLRRTAFLITTFVALVTAGFAIATPLGGATTPLSEPEIAVSEAIAGISAPAEPQVTVASADVAELPIPDISGDCPIVYAQASDGSFVSSAGTSIGSGNLFGVDVSEHNGEIDWEAAKEGGVDFAIIRCGYGSNAESYDDEWWERNVSECERLGIPYGVYLYSYAQDTDRAYSEAAHVIRLVQGHSCPLGIWYDVEEPRQMDAFGYDPDLFAELVSNFATTVQGATGIQVGVYTSRSWLDTHMSGVAASGIPIWCACWTADAPTGCDYVCWQAGAAEIPGFDTPCDFDVIFR